MQPHARLFRFRLATLWMALLGWHLAANPAPAATTLDLHVSASTVGKYGKIEFRIEVPKAYPHPFDPDEVDLSLRITRRDGTSVVLPAFYGQEYERRRLNQGNRQLDWFYPAGLPVWKARFAPWETGGYEAIAILKDRSGTLFSSPVRFECTPSSARGFVRVSARDPRFLEFSEGQPFFPIGQNLAFIGSQQYVTVSKAEEIFARLSENGANYLRIWTGCQDWALAIEARKSAWGRTWDWRPAIVPMAGSTNSARKCLAISGKGAVLKASPSHPLALRPQTRYVVSGNILAEGQTSLRLTAQRTPSRRLASSSPGTWTTFRHELETAPDEFWLTNLSFNLDGEGAAWLSDLSLQEAGGGPELLWEADVNRPVRGFYNPVDCFMLDEILSAAEQRGLYLQLCLMTRDLYLSALKDPASLEYAQAIKDARNFLRYAVARWGYSTSLAAWEYFNEMDPGLPTDRFYTELGNYLEQVDGVHHLRTTSTWGPSPKDCRHAKLDLADVHFYLRPSDKDRLPNEVEAVLDRARFLREQAPGKPAHLGEFGLANEKWQPTQEMQQSRELVEVHNALWASALSGTTGTALFWWWERMDQRNVYPLYRPLSAFLADVPWTGGALQSLTATVPNETFRVIGLRERERAWIWVFDPRAAWKEIVIAQRTPPEVKDARLVLADWPASPCRVQWWDTSQGTVIREEQTTDANGTLSLTIPAFKRDIACKIWR